MFAVGSSSGFILSAKLGANMASVPSGVNRRKVVHSLSGIHLAFIWRKSHTMLKFWNRKADRARQGLAHELYVQLSAYARQPRLYASLEVPDTFDGRFDALALYVGLMLARLRGKSADADELAKEISSLFVADMDRTVREIGVGDLSVGKHVKRMASAMLGRMEAYEAALAADAGEKDLADALVRNVWRGEAPAAEAIAGLEKEVRSFWALLADVPLDELLAGRISGGDEDTKSAENDV